MKKMIMAVIMILAAGVISSNSTGKGNGLREISMDDIDVGSYVVDTYEYDGDSYFSGQGGFYGGSLYQDSFYEEPEICFACGGTGVSKYRCTWCDGSGIDSAYEATKGSVLHAFAEKNCPKCSGSGYPPCMSCGGSGSR